MKIKSIIKHTMANIAMVQCEIGIALHGLNETRSILEQIGKNIEFQQELLNRFKTE